MLKYLSCAGENYEKFPKYSFDEKIDIFVLI